MAKKSLNCLVTNIGGHLIIRRVSIVFSGILLSFILGGTISYVLETHTELGRRALRVIFYSQTMTDQQIAEAIHDDPFRVIQRASLMLDGVVPAVGVILGLLVTSFERRIPGKLTALTFTPYLLWNLRHVAFANTLSVGDSGMRIAKESAIHATCLAIAVVTSVGLARLLSRGRVRDSVSEPG